MVFRPLAGDHDRLREFMDFVLDSYDTGVYEDISEYSDLELDFLGESPDALVSLVTANIEGAGQVDITVTDVADRS